MPSGSLIGTNDTGTNIGSQGPRRPWLLRARSVLAVGTLVTFVLVAGPPVDAHEGGEFGVEVLVEGAPPGADLPLRGAEWPANSVLSVRIRAGTSAFLEISAIRTDDDGHFETTVPLPSDLTTGPATIEVASSNGVIASAVVTVDPDSPAPSGFAESEGAVDPEPVGFDPVPLVALLTLGMAGVLLALRARGRRSAL